MWAFAGKTHITEMASKKNLGHSLRMARKATGLSQDDLSVVSSRSFVSAVERGIKSPTMEKLTVMARAMELQTASILVVATVLESSRELGEILQQVADEAEAILATRH